MYNTLAEGLKSRFYRAKEWAKKNSANFTLLGQFALTALIFFGLGIVYTQNFIKKPPPITIAEPAKNDSASAPTAAVSESQNKPEKQNDFKNMLVQTGNLVASKNGTAYYLTTCYNNIKEENKVYFKTEEDAQKSGFRPAKTCFK